MNNSMQPSWINSARARTYFKVAAIANIFLILAILYAVVTLMVLGAQGTAPVLEVWWLKPVWFLAGTIGAPLTLSLWMGMVWHCAINSERTLPAKVIWLLFLVFANWIVAPLYYMTVYRKGGTT